MIRTYKQYTNFVLYVMEMYSTVEYSDIERKLDEESNEVIGAIGRYNEYVLELGDLFFYLVAKIGSNGLFYEEDIIISSSIPTNNKPTIETVLFHLPELRKVQNAKELIKTFSFLLHGCSLKTVLETNIIKIANKRNILETTLKGILA